MAKESEVYTVHEMAAATRWAQDNGTERSLEFERWWVDAVGDGDTPSQVQWASQCKCGASMSSVMVTWCTAGSLGVPGTPGNQTSSQGYMVMASLVTMCG